MRIISEEDLAQTDSATHKLVQFVRVHVVRVGKCDIESPHMQQVALVLRSDEPMQENAGFHTMNYVDLIEDEFLRLGEEPFRCEAQRTKRVHADPVVPFVLMDPFYDFRHEFGGQEIEVASRKRV